MASTHPAEDVLAHLGSGLLSHFTSGTHSDLVVVCKEDRYNVHKVVLSSHSNWFAKACDGPFPEDEPHAIELNDDDPILVGIMMKYMYQLVYSDTTEEARSNGICPIRLDVLMYAMAEKYELLPLKRLAVHNFEDLANQLWDTDAFSSIIRDVYETTPATDRGLRDIVVSIVARHARTLLSSEKQAETPKVDDRKDTPHGSPTLKEKQLPPSSDEKKIHFPDIVEQLGPFAKDLAVKLSSMIDPAEYRFLCPKCKTPWRGGLPTLSTSHCPFCDHHPDGWENHVID